MLKTAARSLYLTKLFGTLFGISLGIVCRVSIATCPPTPLEAGGLAGLTLGSFLMFLWHWATWHRLRGLQGSVGG